MRQTTRLFISTLFCCFGLFSTAADQADSRLDALFEQLQLSENPAQIRTTESEIWSIWLTHPNSDVERLMVLGTEAMNRRQFPEALLIFTQIVETFPEFAEGWNKRATLYYLVGNTAASVSDIEKTLALEPRHFGALSGLGLVYLQQGKLTEAKDAFEKLIAVHPNSPNAQENLRLVIEQIAVNII
jgi:tetratricopeptide (TPR) repeat protein